MSISEILRRKISVSVSTLALLILCGYIAMQPRENIAISVRYTPSASHGNTGHVDFGPMGTVSILETNALPLKVQELSVGSDVNLPLQGGAIDRVSNRLVIMDRLGATWLFSKGVISPSGLPQLPLHTQEFAKQSAFPLNSSTLSAHDIKADPADGKLYASFESFDGKSGTTRFTIARSSDWPGAHPHWDIIFEGPEMRSKDVYMGHSGNGKMAFKGRALIFSVGDYNLDTGATPEAQDPSRLGGKIYSMDLASGRIDILSRGHRVILGLTVAGNGDIWETENGPRGGDEVNHIIKGRNYGWPFETLGKNYFSYDYSKPGNIGDAIAETIKLNRFEDPVYAWVPSVAISQIVQINGFDKAWDGDFLLGSLKGQSLYRLHMKDGHVVFCEPIWIGHRVRDIVQDAGQIVVWTDEGSLLLLRAASPRNDQGLAFDRTYQDDAIADCANCHTMTGQRSTSYGPNLSHVYGRKIASADYQFYSPTLKSMGNGAWDDQLLRQFIKNAPSVAPGTTMPAINVSDERLNRIIRILKRQ